MKLMSAISRASVRTLTGFATLVVTACGLGDRPSGGMVERSWTEEVLLNDGETILVERAVTYRETNSLSGDSYNAVETDAKLRFTGRLVTLPAWQQPLIALLLYRDGAAAEWVLVATTTSCDVWNRRGPPRVMYLPDKPDTMYWEFRLQDGKWSEVPLSRSSIGRSANLLYQYRHDMEKDQVTVEDKTNLQARVHPDLVSRYVVISERHNVYCGVSLEGRKRREAIDSDTAGTTATEVDTYGN